MEDESLSQQIAIKVMGWILSPKYPSRKRWEPSTSRWVTYENFEDSLDAARTAELRLHEIGKTLAYEDALNGMYNEEPDSDACGWDLWLIYLPARKRCAAMLTAVQP